MPDKDVKLNISKKPKSGNKWKSVVASRGTSYWYKFTGGNKGGDNGDQEFATGSAAETFAVTFKGGDEDDYDFVDFYKDAATDPDDQLSGVVSADKKTLIVTDNCTAPTAGMVYGASVSDVESDEEFICDPVITNRQ